MKDRGLGHSHLIDNVLFDQEPSVNEASTNKFLSGQSIIAQLMAFMPEDIVPKNS